MFHIVLIIFNLICSVIKQTQLPANYTLIQVHPYYHELQNTLPLHRASIATLTGSRVGLMTEIIGAMHLIKVNVWEKLFVNKIQKIRRLYTLYL